MTKGGIIENILKEMRAARSRKIRRPAEKHKEEQEIIEHLEQLLRAANPDIDILTCADFIELNIECCTQCQWFMFPYDMCSVTKLKMVSTLGFVVQ